MRASFIFSEVFTGLRRNVTMTIAMILTTAISLGLFGGGLLVVQMAGKTQQIFLDRVEVQIFLTDDVSVSDPTCDADPCKTLRQTIEDRDVSARCSSSTATTPSTTRSRSSRSPRTSLVSPTPSRPRSRSSCPTPTGSVFNDTIASRPGVESVLNQRDLVERLFACSTGSRNAAFAIAIVQAIAAILLIANMVQIAAFTRRTEVGIMRLVGATRWYTQLPFLLEATLAALVGAVLAIVGLFTVRACSSTTCSPTSTTRISLREWTIPTCSGLAVPGARRCRDGRSHRVRHPSAVRPKIAMAKKADPTKWRKNRVVATNRKARHNYTIIETFEAGIALVGTEVKSLREGKASLVDAFATVDDGEVWLRSLHIPEYTQGSWTNHSPRRTRKLLLHKREIEHLVGKTREGNQTLVPLSMYFSDGKVKVELALAKGKQDYDKRQDLARRTAEREVTREMGRRIKGKT